MSMIFDTFLGVKKQARLDFNILEQVIRKFVDEELVVKPCALLIGKGKLNQAWDLAYWSSLEITNNVHWAIHYFGNDENTLLEEAKKYYTTSNICLWFKSINPVNPQLQKDFADIKEYKESGYDISEFEVFIGFYSFLVPVEIKTDSMFLGPDDFESFEHYKAICEAEGYEFNEETDEYNTIKSHGKFYHYLNITGRLLPSSYEVERSVFAEILSSYAGELVSAESIY